MPIALHESSAHNALSTIAAATAFVVGLRALAVVASVLLSRVGWLCGGVGLTLELTAFALCFFVFCVDSGLTAPLVLSSLALALVIGWSLRSARTLFVGVFVLASLACPPLLSHHVVVVEDASSTGLWLSSYKGERAALSTVSEPCACAAVRQVVVYYDKVRLTEDHSLPPISCDALPEVLRTRALPALEGGDGGIGSDNESDTAVSAATLVESLVPQAPRLYHHVLSIGERTRIDGLHSLVTQEAPESVLSRRDVVVLLGDRSEIRNTILSCDAGADHKRGTAAVGPRRICVAAAAHTAFHNVTFRFSNDGDESAHHGTIAPVEVLIARAETCDAARRQLASRVGSDISMDAILRCSSEEGSASVAERFAELLVDKASHTYLVDVNGFLDHMPTLVAWRWYLPDVFRKIQGVVAFLIDSICAPLGAAVLLLVETLAQLLRELGGLLAERAQATAPYAMVAARHVKSGVLGVLCGTTERPWLALCQDDRDTPAFGVGAQAHDGIAAAVSATLDTLELVPGAWSLLQWGWDMEWRITAGIVRGTRQGSVAVVTKGVLPVARLVARSAERAVHVLARALPQCVGPMQRLGGFVGRSSLGHSAYAGALWLYTEELREMRWERAMVQRAAAFAGRAAATCIAFAWHGLCWALEVISVLLHWYMGTSFSIHVVVILLQTALLLIAVRNEIKELVENKRREQERLEETAVAASPISLGGYGLGSLTRSVTRRLRRSSTASRMSGVVLFVKAHYHACTQYVVTHLVLVVVLVGLSVLPFTGKLYTVTLHFVLPWMSSEGFLSFFCKPSPSWRQVTVFWSGRLVLAILLQRTVGDFLYRLVKDLLIALGLLGTVTVLLWAWPRRGFLARRVATAITESLNNTPIRTGPTPPQAPLLPPEHPDEDSTTHSNGGGDVDVVRRVGLEDGEEEGTTTAAVPPAQLLPVNSAEGGASASSDLPAPASDGAAREQPSHASTAASSAVGNEDGSSPRYSRPAATPPPPLVLVGDTSAGDDGASPSRAASTLSSAQTNADIEEATSEAGHQG